ncbi:DUF2312 domain-containing protein [Methylobrevis pamukkalensis]|uniref:GapR-like DNA-binding domain-containing protein n=1 Tax=Methylobrevis pamukkalensis TaxID=1439726 RepID=A0A1E3GYU7_9HYPH|nr:DUF2312 domain-containing protein [Methylobrevis pamukkalensis]ODN69223.1 hypothetical protein A6302_03485 [Methylobrevis pamukkalensis]
MGSNSISAVDLRNFIDRIENIREQKTALADDEKLVFAEAKALGFSAPTMRDILKIRTQKPADRQEAESLLDLYMSAMGMATETPLFRHVGLMSVDISARESVVEALKELVPINGELIVKAGGGAVRLWRDQEGTAHAEDFVERPAPQARAAVAAAPRTGKAPPPEASPAQAEEMGRQAARDNQAIITNPFPFGDARRPLWDRGWRVETGGDGMGPEDE